jgi:hypothetical protein
MGWSKIFVVMLTNLWEFNRKVLPFNHIEGVYNDLNLSMSILQSLYQFSKHSVYPSKMLRI